jgi:hypothetical protein
METRSYQGNGCPQEGAIRHGFLKVALTQKMVKDRVVIDIRNDQDKLTVMKVMMI